ncbi:MAG: hypothetical protein FJX75_03680 [Armatimonadetes bacterium]|nr:hypothetical protein [Armatimonadota bacterium]
MRSWTLVGGTLGVLMVGGVGALAQDAEVKIPDNPEEYFPMTVGSEWTYDLRISADPVGFSRLQRGTETKTKIEREALPTEESSKMRKVTYRITEVGRGTGMEYREVACERDTTLVPRFPNPKRLPYWFTVWGLSRVEDPPLVYEYVSFVEPGQLHQERRPIAVLAEAGHRSYELPDISVECSRLRDPLTVPAGTFSDCIANRWTNTFLIPFCEELVFARGVGLICVVQRSEEEDKKGEITYEMKLVSYKIAEPAP